MSVKTKGKWVAECNRRVQLLFKVLDAIERVAGDDYCEDLNMRDAAGHEMSDDLKTASSKLGAIYRLAHAYSKNHSCYRVHKDWRNQLKWYGTAR